VAIKLLPPELAVHGALRERFQREARMAARLAHPHIVPIHSVDEVGRFTFYVMAYVRGETLAHRIAARGALPPAEAVRVLREVAWALAHAHAQGVVHRDVKPENILLEEGSGRALVTDFGIARLVQSSGPTGAGEALGTPDFMSPEQASGERVDQRSDVYSLGVVAFYTLAGRLPFTGPTVAARMSQHITQAPPPLPTVAGGAAHPRGRGRAAPRSPPPATPTGRSWPRRCRSPSTGGASCRARSGCTWPRPTASRCTGCSRRSSSAAWRSGSSNR
jgi:serine/threonine-protein kinase